MGWAHASRCVGKEVLTSVSTIDDRVRDLVEPLLTGRDVELVDVEHGGGFLRVTIDRPGGLDLDTISDVTRDVSRLLDDEDPVPGHYTLEVSSPGLERRLRTPSHFRRAVGERVTVKTVPGVEGERRFTGTVAEADERSVTFDVDDANGRVRRTLPYGDIERARTVFEWGPSPKPGSGSKPGRQKKPRREKKKISK